MVNVISLKVSKGGAGKTTIASNLSHVLAMDGKRVLMIDFDSQANLSNIFIPSVEDDQLTSSNLLGDDSIDLDELILEVDENLHLIVADNGLQEVGKYLENQGSYHNSLRDVLGHSSITDEYDYVILDLSPGVSDIITEICLVASDLLIAPTLFDLKSVKGVSHTVGDVNRLIQAEVLKKSVPSILIVPNRYDQRFKKDNEYVSDLLYKNMDKKFISDPIRENSHIKKADFEAKSAIEFELSEKNKRGHKKAVEDFKKLAKKVEKVLK